MRKWIMEESDDRGLQRVDIVTEDGYPVAEVNTAYSQRLTDKAFPMKITDRPAEEVREMGYLLAAAPELLFACKSLAEALDKAGGCRAPIFLEKAIAKAEGKE